MNGVGFLACVIVALDCAEKALGITPQRLFSADALWVWWLAAAMWAFSAYRFIAE